MNSNRIFSSIAFCASMLFAAPAQAQYTVHIEHPVYDNYIMVTGDRVNLRKSPSTDSPRLVSYTMEDAEGNYTYPLAFNNERVITGRSPEVVYGWDGMILPKLGSTAGWYKTYYDRVEDAREVWVSSQFSTPVTVKRNLPLSATKAFYNVYEYGKNADFIRRTSGKFRNLAFSLTATRPEGIATVVMNISFKASDGIHFINVVDQLQVVEEPTPQTPFLKWDKEIIEAIDYEVELTYINLGKVDVTNNADMLSRAKQALLNCSDEEFGQLIEKSFIRLAKKNGYSVRYFVNGGKMDYQTASDWVNAPGSRMLVEDIDFTKNVDDAEAY